MGRDVLVRDGFGATSPGTRMVTCWLVWLLYKPVRNKTDPVRQARQKLTINALHLNSLFEAKTGGLKR